jgi:hypothetical protein
MANPVNNNGISVNLNVGKVLDVNLKIGGTAKIPDAQSTKIFGNVTENLGKNPNHGLPAEQAQDGNDIQHNQTNGNNGNHAADPPALLKDINDETNAPPTRGNRTLNNHNENEPTARDLPRGKGNNQINHGQNGDLHAADQGLENGKGHFKTQNQGQNLPNPTTDFPENHHEDHHDHFDNKPLFTGRNTDTPRFGEHFSVDFNLKANGNQPNGLIRTVVNQILRQNDIYLSNNAVNRLVNNQSSTAFPKEINNLVQNIGSRVLSLLNNSPQSGATIHEISKKIAQQLQENIQTSKNTFLKNTDIGATTFKQLNIGERMNVAVELMPRHLSANMLENLQHFKSNQIVDGLLIARGLVVPGERPTDVRNFIANKSIVLPNEITITTLRDVGQLVKILISDAAGAKSTMNLDLAVQKFVRLMIANNEMGVLLATINLAAQTQDRGGLVSRSLALVQIYELISQLLLAGEKAMKSAQPQNAPKNIFQKERSDLQTVKSSTLEENDELKTQLNKTRINGAESTLRQFLEFNPAFVHDNSASAFNNPDDARQAQKDFVSLYHNDIEQWLRSGNHRYVKDHDFEKPVGIVVERNNDAFFTANKARFVLVRDGSVQGWHFLKSFLVK